jgi:Mrp family chromosome partitioning ATPase/capsular polysaccharide biosynthesis protein
MRLPTRSQVETQLRYPRCCGAWTWRQRSYADRAWPRILTTPPLSVIDHAQRVNTFHLPNKNLRFGRRRVLLTEQLCHECNVPVTRTLAVQWTAPVRRWWSSSSDDAPYRLSTASATLRVQLSRGELIVDTSTTQPGVFSAMWRFRWLVLATVVVFSALAYVYGSSRPPAYVAEASLVVKDPQATGVFENATGSPERYVTDQMAILESAVVAERAAELTREKIPSADVDTQDILNNVDILGGPDSDVIDVSYEASDSEVAQVVTNSMITAYQEIRRSDALSTSTAALETLDASLQTLDQELASIRRRISEIRTGQNFSSELDQQMDDAIARLLELWDQRGATSNPTSLAIIDAELAEVGDTIRTIGVVQDVRVVDPEEAALLEEQDAVLGRRVQLQERRDQMIVDAELTSGGVVVLSPALPGESGGPGLQRVVAVALVLGLLAGAGLAYLLAQRRRTFGGRSEPELVLNAPLLAEVPVFTEEGIKSKLPVRTDRFSASAESFRFVAAAIDIQEDLKTVVAVSSTLGEGKTTVVANTAMAAAREGNAVLLIDADFGDQSLSRILLNGREVERGLTELVEEGLEPIEVVEPITQGSESNLGLIGRGRRPVTAPDFFRSAGAQEFFTKVRERFDLVLIDAPPLLQVAYASTVARYADAAMVVVPHDGDVGDLEEAAARLSFIGIPIAGYVYNYAPLRSEMIASKKSMKNTLGTESSDEEIRRRVPRHRA